MKVSLAEIPASNGFHKMCEQDAGWNKKTNINWDPAICQGVCVCMCVCAYHFMRKVRLIEVHRVTQSHGLPFKPGSASLKSRSFPRHCLQVNAKPGWFFPHRAGSWPAFLYSGSHYPVAGCGQGGLFPRLHTWKDSTLTYSDATFSKSLLVALPLAPPAGSTLCLIQAAAHLRIARGRVVCADIPIWRHWVVRALDMISQWVLPTFDSAHNGCLEIPITLILHIFPAQKKLDLNFLSFKEMHLNVKGANLLMQSALLAWQI